MNKASVSSSGLCPTSITVIFTALHPLDERFKQPVIKIRSNVQVTFGQTIFDAFMLLNGLSFVDFKHLLASQQQSIRDQINRAELRYVPEKQWLLVTIPEIDKTTMQMCGLIHGSR
jgi:hypothetical protein